MKNLSEILADSYRIIEFSDEHSFVSEFRISDEKFLTILKSKNNNKISNETTIILNDEPFINAIARNSSDIIILNSVGFRELRALFNTSEASNFYIRITAFNIFFIAYKFIKNSLVKQIKMKGIYYLRKKNKVFFYIGVSRKAVAKRTRHYLSPIVPIEDFFQTLNDQNIKYCVLRWFDNLPEVQPNEDVDLLVEDNDLEKLHSIIDARPGIIPFDIYSKTGKPGSDFQSMPYHILSLSEKSLNETILYKNKFKVPNQENYFYLLTYHAVFHKGENSGLPCEKFDLKLNGKPDHDYLSHLKKIASEAELSVEDFTLESLHSLLESIGYAPPLDTLYKLSINNKYLKAYLGDHQKNSRLHSIFEGLVCFVAREKIIEKNLLDDLVKYIQKEGFTVLRVMSFNDQVKSNFTKHVRGGNWNQGPWPVSGGLPAAIIVALDVYPVKPEASDYQLHPGLTNRRIIYKNEIRDFINVSLENESEWFNGIHSSDNEIQAVEYLSLAGINENEIYDEIIKYKQVFETRFPVLSVLSQYSKRAKVELINFNGTKAVKKTFKPNCENFLENEIKACKLFQSRLPIPELLETGPNYIITSYIESSRHFGNRISINSLKKCLSILRQVYDEGYSLLDFKPENFLVDKKKNIYLIDFEFLYRYNIKPNFLECFDLVGPPKKIDTSLMPITHIPAGVNQFDALWYNSTGVKYEELSRLDRFILKPKSIVRLYNFRRKDLFSKIMRFSKRALKIFYRHLP